MPGPGDISLANLPEPRSVEEVAAIVLAVDRAAERRYATLARELRALGSPTVAALLERLGGEHGAQAGRLEAGAEPRDTASGDLTRLLPEILAERGAAACDLLNLTPYRVLAFAVDLAQQTFKLYSYLAAAADNEVRDYAHQLASEQLSRAARLRVERRRAYRAGSQRPNAGAYPTAGLVESEADLLAAALAIEDRLAQRLAEAREQQAGLSSTCQATRQGVEALRRASDLAGEAGGLMAELLAEFSLRAPRNERADRDRAGATRHLLADCERAFTFYDAVASAPADEAVMLQAQDLSRAALERIRALS